MQIGLYIHIPFCTSKCYYCDFLSFPGDDKQEAYVDTLVKELQYYGESLSKDIAVKSIFIGGGTPTVLPPLLLDKIAKAVITYFRLTPDVEWTIESNPGTLTLDQINVLKQYPITRISMGLQSTHDHLLKRIGRIHTFKDWEKSMALVRAHTTWAINADLMFALPEQTEKEFKDSVETVVKYEPEHLSIYALIIEEGTRFGDLYEQGKLKEVEETIDRNMYHFAQAYLDEMGYKQYEISNWAKTGHECKHNILYWRREPYIGVGLGAHGLFNEVRYSNETKLSRYVETKGMLNQIRIEEESITKEDAMAEYMFLGLRMLDGINEKDFEKQFNVSVWEVYKSQLTKWIKYKLLEKNKDNIRLTPYGLDVCNEVFASFL